ncbi:MAG: hypothetical protein ACYTG7_09115 [Planctomycetota bacterium]
MDDLRYAGSWDDYCKKGIASDWDSDVACVAWADNRDITPLDFDTYTDHGVNLGIMVDRCVIYELTGGTVNFTLNAGASNAGRNYILLGSVSGTEPGTPLPGGHAILPINWDPFTDTMLALINTPYLFHNFMGVLNGDGMATATLIAPPVPGYAYYTMYYAFTINDPFDYASNAAAIPIMP